MRDHHPTSTGKMARQTHQQTRDAFFSLHFSASQDVHYRTENFLHYSSKYTTLKVLAVYVVHMPILLVVHLTWSPEPTDALRRHFGGRRYDASTTHLQCAADELPDLAH